MQVTVEYLEERHAYWRRRVGVAGIWDAGRFRPVRMVVKRKSKSYEGMFRRKTVRRGLRVTVSDEIILYDQGPDATVREIDETLVHEMIHQYIIQNDLPDTRTHGRVFQRYMGLINAAFPGELEISVRGMAKRQSGPGETVHYLLILRMERGDNYVCVVNPKKIGEFVRMVERDRRRMGVRDVVLAVSDDRYFETFSRCTTWVHGLRIPESGLAAFIRDYRLRGLSGR